VLGTQFGAWTCWGVAKGNVPLSLLGRGCERDVGHRRALIFREDKAFSSNYLKVVSNTKRKSVSNRCPACLSSRGKGPRLVLQGCQLPQASREQPVGFSYGVAACSRVGGWKLLGEKRVAFFTPCQLLPPSLPGQSRSISDFPHQFPDKADELTWRGPT
jgi:hypothetical protein